VLIQNEIYCNTARFERASASTSRGFSQLQSKGAGGIRPHFGYGYIIVDEYS
jgi:hypothetical protein